MTGLFGAVPKVLERRAPISLCCRWARNLDLEVAGKFKNLSCGQVHNNRAEHPIRNEPYWHQPFIVTDATALR